MIAMLVPRAQRFVFEMTLRMGRRFILGLWIKFERGLLIAVYGFSPYL